MGIMLNLRGKNHETDKKNVTKLDDQNHRDSDCSWHDFNRICCNTLEMIIPSEKISQNPGFSNKSKDI
jgi:hypothetical protein